MKQSKDSSPSQLLRGLNSVQKQAVEQVDGPNLILAGAGSGKTRVLTHKIAYLIDRKKVNPENIIAMTFTNKAANEMKERVANLLKGDLKGLWIGTFHSIFARILRTNCEKLGFSNNFVIYDESDQLSLLKSVINQLDFPNLANLNIKSIQSRIKLIKNANMSPDDIRSLMPEFLSEIYQRIYQEYEKKLLENNAMDFEDLLLKAIKLFKLFPLVAAFYQKKFLYVLVDEYQDTNRLQYELLKMLNDQHKNISVVGDDDQSIYRWRGAEIRNILEFERDFPNCHIFRLEQNYRSTLNILKIAHSIISHNVNRMEKELWTKKDSGEKITLKIVDNAMDEARFLVQKIEEEIQQNRRNFSDFAVLYRINAQSRSIEDALKNAGISYIVVGGIRFYERKEIKDVLAYLRVLVNPQDSISLKRIINYPMRNIGQATIDKVEKFANDSKITMFQAICDARNIEVLPEKKRSILADFGELLEKYIALKETIPISELITTLIEDLGIFAELKAEETPTAYSRLENIREFIYGIDEYLKNQPDSTLEHYLEKVALISDIDNWDTKANAVSLLTLHSAKGLEFPVVFISGLEEGLFPLARQMAKTEDLEEERRLFYVGATRAEEKLYLSAAKYRRQYGEGSNNTMSRFLSEIDHNLVEKDLSSVPIWSSGSFHSDRDNKVKKTIKFDSQRANKLKSGTLVKHPRFGRGVVRKIEGSGAEEKAYILFETLGEKIIITKYGKLEILS